MRPYEHGGDVYGDDDIRLDFSVNTNPLGMPEAVKDAVIRQLPDYVRYPDPHCRALRRALSAQHALPPESILCGNGASDLLFRITAAMRPRRVLTLAPTFSEYARSATLFGGEMREYRLREGNGFCVDGGILSALTAEVDMLFLCNPNNPTGRLCEPALLQEIASRCRDLGTRMVLDECFLDFTEGASLAPLLGDHPNLLILKAFTKLYAMAGLRLGYLLCADEKLLARIEAFGAEWSVSAVAQAAGLAALSVPDWAKRTRALVTEERAYLKAALAGLGLQVYESDANFLLVRGGASLFAPLRKRGLLVRDCSNFTGLDERYFRIGVKTREENERLVRAIEDALDDTMRED